jgi:hypothetical protein
LFIGNGAVSEGAPYVGRTKILTEHDSILDLVANYTYKYDSELEESSVFDTVTRTLQSKLDDGIVNARSFGIKSIEEDAAGDQTEAIQAAINSIVSEVGTNVTIEFDPGEYTFSNTITLPSNTKIAGYGKDQTVFNYVGTSRVLFTTEEDAVKIKLNDFTIKTNADNKTLLNIDNAKGCEFVNIKLLHTSGTAGTLATDRIGINLSGNKTVSYNRFKGIEFKSLTYGVYTVGDASFNKFEDCLLEFLHQGFNLGTLGTNDSSGASYNSITNCIFDNISRQGLFVQKGTGNRSRGNTYKNVGAEQSGTFSTFSAIRFVTDGNSSVHDIFERQEFLEPNNVLFNNNPYIAEIDGVSYREKNEPRQITLISTTFPTMAFKVGIGNATGVQVNYVYRSTVFDQMRRGTLSIAVDKDLNLVRLSDEYEYVGLSPAGEDAVIFTATLEKPPQSDVKVLRINYINNNVGDANTFTYTYSVLS